MGQPADYLDLKYVSEIRKVTEHSRNLPFANSELIYANIKDFRLLTCGDDVKKVYEVCLDVQGNHVYKPGDTIGILPENNNLEVDQLLDRLHLNHLAESFYELSILKATTKKKPGIPPHIPVQGCIKDLFLKYLDIRSIPKKLFLKSLVPYTKGEADIEKLNTITDPKQSNLYEKFVMGEGCTLLKMLEALPTCNPPLERLLEHLSPLLPRYYSIASSPLRKNEIVIVFSVTEGKNYKGVCTGWLENHLELKGQIPMYFRKPGNFLQIEDTCTPMILIGPGTGVAPFIGFLEHRFLLGNKNTGHIVLYFGCRYSNRDYLYKDDLLRYLDEGVLNELETTFSRETEKKMYVQDRILKNGKKITNLILNSDGVVCICGDGKNMMRDVENALVKCLVTHGDMTESEASDLLMDLKKNNKFQLDIWI